MSFNISIVEYFGKVVNGVLVLLSIIYEEEYYEATFFYTDKTYALVISEELEEKIGIKIQEHPEYQEIITYVQSKVVPYKEIYNRLDFMTTDRWTEN
jgi:hypothetical protein